MWFFIRFKCIVGELVRGNFPIMMDALFAQVITEDLNADGQLGKNNNKKNK